MANVLYNSYAAGLFGGIDLENDTIRILLIRSTSSYTPDKDHEFLDEFFSGSGVEISVASYTRQTLGTIAVTQNDTNDRGEFSSAPANFGTLESGQTVKGFLIYKQVGGSDATPENDPLICHIDTDSAALLPVALADANFTVSPHSSGWLRAAQA